MEREVDFSADGIDFSVQGRVATVTLNRPDKLNALLNAGVARLSEIWQRVRDDPEIWVIVVGAVGDRAFCSGIDLTDQPSDSPEAREKDRTDPLMTVGPLHHQCYKPVVVAVNGLCAGIALDFVTEADIVIATPNASFFDPHVSIGNVSAHEMVQLSRRAPLSVALSMNALGKYERMSAERACALGLVYEVVSAPLLASRASALANIIVRNSPRAVQLGKELLLRGHHMALADAIALAEDFRKSHVGAPDYIEGPLAFLAKRDPAWLV